MFIQLGGPASEKEPIENLKEAAMKSVEVGLWRRETFSIEDGKPVRERTGTVDGPSMDVQHSPQEVH